MRYNWQQADWPRFSYSFPELEDLLFLFAEKAGRLAGMVQALPEGPKAEALLALMVSEAIKTSEIEGEYLSRQDVMSSIKNKLGLSPEKENVRSKAAEGIGELMVAVRGTYAEVLTEQVLFQWHGLLFRGRGNLMVGGWRTHEEPMQVVSGALGKEKVHFEAPPSALVPTEIEGFLRWFNDTAPAGGPGIKQAPLRAAIAHLYFETIHPFEDGNGRIGRAIAEKALSQGLGRPALLSLSQAIEADKKAYYQALSTAQQSNEITPWLRYFVQMVLDAQAASEAQIEFILKKARFFDRFRDRLNERQTRVIRRMLDEGPEGFAGGMNAGKYGSLMRVSKATATRDLQALLQIGALIPFGEGGGRSTSYAVNLDPYPAA